MTQPTKELIENMYRDADKWSDNFRLLNILLAVALAVIGALIAAGAALLNEIAISILGVLSAGLGAFNKAVDPGKSDAQHTARKRALELLLIEAASTDGSRPFSDIEIERLAYRSKQDSTTVIEEIVRKTSAK